MDPEVKVKWLEALRSGKYKQCTGLLKDQNPENEKDISFCCLGVLADLAIENGYDKLCWNQKIIGEAISNTVSGEGIYLPAAVAAWAGIKYSNYRNDDRFSPKVQISSAFLNKYPKYSNSHCEYMEVELAELNDVGFTFEQIAFLIEEQL
jgi:hypothetical protein